jgi:hypothetical protein
VATRMKYLSDLWILLVVLAALAICFIFRDPRLALQQRRQRAVNHLNADLSSRGIDCQGVLEGTGQSTLRLSGNAVDRGLILARIEGQPLKGMDTLYERD